jgi:hypothetical protein
MLRGIGPWGIVTLIFLGFIFVAVLTHARGFSSAAGTLFTGVNGIGTTLEGNSSSNSHMGGQSRASRNAFAA